MRKLILNWDGPFGSMDSIPKGFRGWPGIYLIEVESEILYIGKAETEGAFRRAKDHFRGQGDSTGKWILGQRDESKIRIWIAVKDWDEMLSDAEKLLISILKPRANITHVKKYNGKPLHIINKGKYPTSLPKEAECPVRAYSGAQRGLHYR